MRWLDERRRRNQADRLTQRVSVLSAKARQDLFAEAVREGVLTQEQADALETAARRGQAADRLVDARTVSVPVISRDDALRQASSVDRSVPPMAIVFVLSLTTLYLAVRPISSDNFWLDLKMPLLGLVPLVLVAYSGWRWRARAAINKRVLALGVSVEDFGLGGRIRRRTAHPGNLLLFQFTVLGLGLVSTIDIILMAVNLGDNIGGLAGMAAGAFLFLAGLTLIMVTWLTFATIHFTRVVLDDIEAETRAGGSSGSETGPGAVDRR